MIGLDFGTTNSAVARCGPGDAIRFARFETLHTPEAGDAAGDGRTSTFRSVLHFSAEQRLPGAAPIPWAGPRGLGAYLDEGAGRLLQSLKSHLGSRSLRETFVHGHRFEVEDLIAVILRDLRTAAIEQLGDSGEAVLLGRPVHFVHGTDVGSDLELDAFAEGRLIEAAHRAGFSRVEVELEPLAAAAEVESSLSRDELVLIGDFGGGTSDFCLIRLGPGQLSRRDRRESVVAVAGVPRAGDALDGRIVRSVVAPALGAGREMLSASGQVSGLPQWVYRSLERWEELSLLGEPRRLEALHRLLEQEERQARESGGRSHRFVESIVFLVKNDLGHLLSREVERAKIELSQVHETRLCFDALPRRLRGSFTREAFEQWIAADIELLSVALDELLERGGVAAESIDRVFLTGGTSLVPCVRALFEDRFGAERLRSGGELTSVASGLARLAAEREAARSD